MSRIVVCGAGVCGLVTAMVLAKDGHDVVVLERDPATPPPPEEAWAGWERKGVNQFRLPHFLLPGFRSMIESELPEVAAALDAGGALRLNVLGPFAEALDPDNQHVVLTARRPVVEAAVAAAADAMQGLTVRRGVAVEGVIVEDGSTPPRVVGLRTEDCEEVRADLVVDAGGRRSPMARWLTEAGARQAVLEEEDSGFVYYGRHVRPAEGEFAPPSVEFHGSVGLLVLPADRGTTGVGIIGSAGDAELRTLRHEAPWRAAMALIPGGAAILDAEPVSGLVAMAGIEDKWRRFIVDGEPVATGVVSVADAWAATNPTLGRGISLGTRHAVALRDLLRDVEAGDHRRVVERFDEVTQEEHTPWYRSTVWHDRHRMADIDAEIEGRPRPEGDELWDRFLAFSGAAFSDMTLLPQFLATFQLQRRPEEVLADPAIVAHMTAADIKVPERSGPPRAELLAAVSAAS